MKVVIAGPAQVGKSTLYNALTRQDEDPSARYSTDSRMAMVEVPDRRVDRLIEMFKPRKEARASIQVVEGGAAAGSGGRFGGQFLQELRQADAVIVVVRAFENPAAPVEGGIDPARDLADLEAELIIADLDLVEKRLERLAKEDRSRPKSAKGGGEQEVLLRLREHLESELPLSSMRLSEQDEEAIRHLDLVSRKPLIVVANINESAVGTGAGLPEGLKERAAAGGIPVMDMCVQIEAEIAQLPPDEEQSFLDALSLNESGRDRLVRAIYERLGLCSFFTVGEDEVKAWTIRQGDDAVTAAGKIHSDLARGFIRAEVIHCDDLLRCGSAAQARQAGLYRLEGKNYKVRDGDTLNIRFSV